MVIGRSLSNLNGFIKNRLLKDAPKLIDDKGTHTLSVEKMKSILSFEKDEELKYFILSANLPEISVNWKEELVTISNIEFLQSKVNRKVNLFYSFDENDLLEVNLKGVSTDRKREVLFKQKTILEKIYNESNLTKEDLHLKLYPNNIIESGLISKEEGDDIEYIILNDLSTLEKYSIPHQKLGELLNNIISSKCELFIINKKGKEYVYLVTKTETPGNSDNPFKKGEILDPEKFTTIVYLFDSNGNELILCGIIGDFIHDYAFFEGTVSLRVDTEKLIEYFHLDEGIQSLETQFLTYEKLFGYGDDRSREVISNLKFDWYIESYKADLELAKINFEKHKIIIPEWDIDTKLGFYINELEIGTIHIPESYIATLDEDIAADRELIIMQLLNLMRDAEKALDEREFCVKMVDFLS